MSYGSTAMCIRKHRFLKDICWFAVIFPRKFNSRRGGGKDCGGKCKEVNSGIQRNKKVVEFKLDPKGANGDAVRRDAFKAQARHFI